MNPSIENYLSATYHGTTAGQLIADLGKKVLPEDYNINGLNDRETVTEMLMVLDAVRAKIGNHLSEYPFKD